MKKSLFLTLLLISQGAMFASWGVPSSPAYIEQAQGMNLAAQHAGDVQKIMGRNHTKGELQELARQHARAKVGLTYEQNAGYDLKKQQMKADSSVYEQELQKATQSRLDELREKHLASEGFMNYMDGSQKFELFPG